MLCGVSEPTPRSPWLPPRFVVRGAWKLHRFYHRVTGGRRGLRLPKDRMWGTLVLTTVGRKSGQRREAIDTRRDRHLLIPLCGPRPARVKGKTSP